jgi:hypothetical protein
MNSNLTWVRYDASRVLVSVMGLSPGAELAHHRFSNLFWATGQWPLASLSVAPEQARSTPEQWPGILEELTTLGWREQSGRLVNAEVRRVLDEARQVHRARQAFCRAAAHPRA